MRDIQIEINSILDDYREDIQDGILKAAKKVSKEAVTELKNTSPKMTGDYAKGWKSKIKQTTHEITATVYNAKKPYLTHLLEKGHNIKNKTGSYGRTKPIVHIKPVEEKAKINFEKEVKEVLGK